MPDWLPRLVVLADYGGNWEKYVEALYAYFRADFVDDCPFFRGVRVGVKRYPTDQGKELTFWHVISEGADEYNRIPNMRRCERIRWPRPIVEHSEHPDLKVWENKRKRETRVCIWFEDVEYLVVLAVRKGYMLLWTAYPVTRDHTRRKLLREYEGFVKANAAPR